MSKVLSHHVICASDLAGPKTVYAVRGMGANWGWTYDLQEATVFFFSGGAETSIIHTYSARPTTEIMRELRAPNPWIDAESMISVPVTIASKIVDRVIYDKLAISGWAIQFIAAPTTFLLLSSGVAQFGSEAETPAGDIWRGLNRGVAENVISATERNCPWLRGLLAPYGILEVRRRNTTIAELT